jgi:hypothetical protein
VIEFYGNIFSKKLKIKFYNGREQIYKFSILDSIFKHFWIPKNEAFIYLDGKYKPLNWYLDKKISTPIYDSFYVKEQVKESKKKVEAIINNSLPKLRFYVYLDGGKWQEFGDIIEVTDNTEEFILVVIKEIKEKETIIIPKNRIIRTNYYNLVLDYKEENYVLYEK